MTTVSDLLLLLDPYYQRKGASSDLSVSGTGGGSTVLAHYLNDPSIHLGTLDWSMVNKAGSDLTDIATRPHSALTGIGPDDHHARQHNMLGVSDHVYTGGNALDLFGLTGTSNPGLITPSANPGAASAVLRTNVSGNLALASLTTPSINTASGNLTISPTGDALEVTKRIAGGFGAASTGGTTDWNDTSNARSGGGFTLLLANASNGPSAAGSNYFHPFNFEYNSKDGSGNITQLAIPYALSASIDRGIFMRGRFSGTWSNWVKLISENTSGNVLLGTFTDGGFKLDVSGTARISTSLTTPLITTATNTDLVINPAGTGAVQFPNDQKIRTSSFDSSFPITGWQINEVTGISGKSALTIGSISADELFIKYFVADETRIRRGQQYWTYSNGIVSRDFTTPSAIAGTVRVYFENSPAITGAIFVNSDWVMFQYIDNSGGGFIETFIWGQVSSYIDEGGGEQSWLFTLRNGLTSTAMRKGTEAIDFGASGAALIQLSVVDVAGSPYISMRRWAGANPYTPANHTTYVRVGDLGGISNSYYTPAGDGIYICSTASAAQFIIADDNGVQLRGADFKEYNGANQTVSIASSNGTLKLGTDISSTTTTGFTFDGATGNVTIGGGSYAATVTVYGQINVLGGNAAKTDFSNITATLDALGDGSTYKRTTANEKTGAGRAFTAINSSNNLVTSVIPASAITPSGAGLYLGSNFLGYYSGSVWKTYMDNTGNLVLLGNSSTNYLQWNASSNKLQGVGSNIEQWYADATTGRIRAGQDSVQLGYYGLDLLAYTGSDPNPTENIKALSFWDALSSANGSNRPAGRIWGAASGSSTQYGIQIDVFHPTQYTSTYPNMYISIDVNTPYIRRFVLDDFDQITLGGTTITVAGALSVSGTATLHNLANAAASTYDIGTVGAPWRNLYVDTIVAGTITGSVALGGQTWQYDTGDMFIKSNSASARTLYVSNPGAGLMHLDVEGSITLGGLVDGVDVAALKSSFDSHVAAGDPHTGYLLADGSRTGASSQAQAFTNGLTTSGRVGINVASPAFDLDILGSIGTQIKANASSASAVLRMTTANAAGSGTGNADLQFYDGSTQAFRFLAALGNSSGTRYGGFLAYVDRDGGKLPLQFHLTNNAGALTKVIEFEAGSSIGTVDIGNASLSATAKIYTPSLNSSFASYLQISGSYGTPSLRSVVNLSAYGVQSGGGYASDLVLSTTTGTSLIEVLRLTAASATVTGQVTINPGSALPPLILNSNGQGQTVVGLKADQLNRTVTAGNGMSGGGGLTADITLTLGTPSSLTVSTTNSVSSGTHGHAITSSNNPGAAAALLASTSAGGLTLQTLTLAGSGTVLTATTGYMSIADDTDVVNKLGRAAIGHASYSDYAAFSHRDMTGAGQYGVLHAALGDLYLNAATSKSIYHRVNNADVMTMVSDRLDPAGNSAIWLGDWNRKWAGIHVTDLIVENLVASNVMATIGGRIAVAPTAKLTRDITTTATTIYVDTNSWTINQEIYRTGYSTGGVPSTERMRLQSGPTNTGTNEWSYTVIRRIAGTANLVSNPGFEVNLTGWSTIGTAGTLTHDTTSGVDVASAKLVMPNSPALGYSGISISVAVTSGTVYAVSYWLKTTSVTAMTVDVADTSVLGNHSAVAGTTGWTRYSFEFTAPTTETVNLRFYDLYAATGGTFWIDDVIFEAKVASAGYAWLTGDAFIDTGYATGTGWIDLSSVNTILGHYGPTQTIYARPGTGAPGVAVVTQGNMRSFVDYGADKFGFGVGNDLTLTPTGGFSGMTGDATNGLRLFNVDLALYSGGVKALSIDSTNGMRLATGAGSINNITWYNALSGGYDQAIIGANLSSGTSALTLTANAKDVSTGTFSGQSIITLSNTTTTGYIRLLANDGSADGPYKYIQVDQTAAQVRFKSTSAIYFTGAWGGYPDASGETNSEISNDIGTFQQLMLVGPKYSGNRKVGIWDQLQIGGISFYQSLNVNGRVYLVNTTAPGTPTGGGVIYVQSGALKYIGTGGTITTLAPA